jgi:RNA polymerase sigma-70 factor, ECF subfamily
MHEGQDEKPPDTLTLAELVRRIGSGDRRAEALFAERYLVGIRTLVRRHCRPHEPLVEDLAQDVILIVLEHLRACQLSNPDALPGYIRSTVVFVTTAEYRKRGRRGENLPLEAAQAVTSDDEPDRQLVAEQLAGQVGQLLGHLNVPRDRELLHQFYVLERSKDDVCRNLGIEPAHFHRVAHRARERMRAILETSGLRHAD